jgi:zinc transport system permease protein
MRQALIAVLIISPLLALIGTLVVNNRMAFFSDAIGHASLAGLGLGVILGLADPLWALVGFAVVLGVGIFALQRFTRSTMDTVISLSMCVSIAVGVVLLSRGGSFSRYSSYLIGDLLSITPREINQLLVTGLVVGAGLLLGYNRILLIGLNESLAGSRSRGTWWPQMLFCATIAFVVTMNLGWVGILIINSLLVLPAAAARNLANDARQYVLLALAISLLCGVAGLLVSFYANTATGATIVLVTAACYVATLGVKWFKARAG